MSERNRQKNVHVIVGYYCTDTFSIMIKATWPRGLTEVLSYHGLPDVGQSALGFVFCKLQTADVLQTSSVLAHLLVDDQLHTSTGEEIRIKMN